MSERLKFACAVKEPPPAAPQGAGGSQRVTFSRNA
jgi:hypothetical protein